MSAGHHSLGGAQGTKMNWRVGVLIAGFIVGGCSVDVNGFVGNEKFTGTVSQGFGTGTMNVKGDTGTKCLGRYSARGMASGDGFLHCDDGRQAVIRYENTSLGVGYGYGTTNTGDVVDWIFGISAEAAAQRIGELPGRAAGASGSGHGRARGSTGTGFFITRQGHILTNAHVVELHQRRHPATGSRRHHGADRCRRQTKRSCAFAHRGTPDSDRSTPRKSSGAPRRERRGLWLSVERAGVVGRHTDDRNSQRTRGTSGRHALLSDLRPLAARQ